jgi:hypothetical protein
MTNDELEDRNQHDGDMHKQFGNNRPKKIIIIITPFLEQLFKKSLVMEPEGSSPCSQNATK